VRDRIVELQRRGPAHRDLRGGISGILERERGRTYSFGHR
jgi:hypothetical protein